MNEPRYPDIDNSLGGSRKAANVPDEATYPLTSEEFLCTTDVKGRDDRLSGLSGVCLSCGVSMIVAFVVHLFTATWTTQSGDSASSLRVSSVAIAVIYAGIGFGGIIGYALRKELKNNSYTRLKRRIQDHFRACADEPTRIESKPKTGKGETNDQ
jgi:hypothetical protein